MRWNEYRSQRSVTGSMFSDRSYSSTWSVSIEHRGRQFEDLGRGRLCSNRPKVPPGAAVESGIFKVNAREKPTPEIMIRRPSKCEESSFQVPGVSPVMI